MPFIPTTGISITMAIRCIQVIKVAHCTNGTTFYESTLHYGDLDIL